jgi:hypothetical protein
VRLPLLLLAGLALAAPVLAPDEAPVRFVVLGDTGHGNAAQFQVAQAALQVCQARGCDFVLGAGDNIYPNGVGSAYDAQFGTKFEQPYASFTIPFWMAQGNHDNGDLSGQGRGDGGQSFKGDFEVAYGLRTDRASDRWHMPARNYTFRLADVQVWALDTNTLMWMGDPLGVRDPLGLQQLLWLRQTMDESDARWKIAFGHHPYWSNGDAGDAGVYNGVPGLGLDVKLVLEQAVCGRADAYFAGHDHDLQWLQPSPACGKTQLVVSGAGSGGDTLADPERHPVLFQQEETPGFAWVEAGQEMRIAFYDSAALLLYEGAVAHA